MPKGRRSIDNKAWRLTLDPTQPKRDRSGKNIEGPQYEVTGQHVIIFVAVVFAAAWFSGLLPDP